MLLLYFLYYFFLYIIIILTYYYIISSYYSYYFSGSSICFFQLDFKKFNINLGTIFCILRGIFYICYTNAYLYLNVPTQLSYPSSTICCLSTDTHKHTCPSLSPSAPSYTHSVPPLGRCTGKKKGEKKGWLSFEVILLRASLELYYVKHFVANRFRCKNNNSHCYNTTRSITVLSQSIAV